MLSLTSIPHRSLVQITGTDRYAFLRGLITQDIEKLKEGRAIYTALLNPQGKFQHDLFIIGEGKTFWIDCERARAAELLRRLSLFKLRTQVDLIDRTHDHVVVALWGADLPKTLPLGGWYRPISWNGIAFQDPRLLSLGCRVFLPSEISLEKLAQTFKASLEPFKTYDYHRLSLGVPDGSRDMVVDKSMPLECGLDELNAISWEKGCYMGQELIARTRYRGVIRKRLLPVDISTEEDPIALHTPILLGEKVVGDMRSQCQGRALALLRLEALQAFKENPRQVLLCEGARLTPKIPPWMVLSSDETKGSA